MMYYSATTGGFYLPATHPDRPADCVEITQERWRDLLAGQAQGATICPDQAGHPTLSQPPAPGPAVAPVPASVPLARAKIALRRAGHLAAADAAIAALTGDDGEEARIAWAGWDAISRTSPLLARIAQTLSFPPAAIDDLFRTAAAITL